MAYANHVSHVISILCAIKKFNYLFHLLMKLICWFGFLLFHSLLSSWLSCSFFFYSFSLLLELSLMYFTKTATTKILSWQYMTNKFVCMFALFCRFSDQQCVYVSVCAQHFWFTGRARQSCFVTKLICQLVLQQIHGIFITLMLFHVGVLFYRFKRCPHKVTDAFTLLCFGLAWFGLQRLVEPGAFLLSSCPFSKHLAIDMDHTLNSVCNSHIQLSGIIIHSCLGILHARFIPFE